MSGSASGWIGLFRNCLLLRFFNFESVKVAERARERERERESCNKEDTNNKKWKSELLVVESPSALGALSASFQTKIHSLDAFIFLFVTKYGLKTYPGHSL